MVPVVEALRELGCKLSMASSGQALEYLRNRYPDLPSHELPAPRIRYGRWGASWGLFRHSLSQKRWNRKQQEWIRSMQNRHSFDAIISDNLYGVYHRNVPSVLVSHQLHLLSPVFRKSINKELGHWLNNFDQIWVPDVEEGLADGLTHNPFCEKPIQHIGPLSRLKPLDDAECKYRAVALISGPEPQRSFFEEACQQHLNQLDGPTAMVRGLPHLRDAPSGKKGQCEQFAFLDDAQLTRLLLSADYVICRSGYSTLCDLSALGCRALLVPTPGQPEQLYLAGRCAEMKWFQSSSHRELKYREEVSADFQPPQFSRFDLQGFLRQWIG